MIGLVYAYMRPGSRCATATTGQIRRKLLIPKWNAQYSLMRVAFTSDLHIDITAHNRELQICSLMVASLQRDLERIPSEIAKVAVALHTSPFLSWIERKQVPDFFDAYEGCTRVGEVLGRCATERAVTVIPGHRHKPLDITQDGVRVVRCPVGYLNDSHGDYQAKAAEVIGLVEL